MFCLSQNIKAVTRPDPKCIPTVTQMFVPSETKIRPVSSGRVVFHELHKHTGEFGDELSEPCDLTLPGLSRRPLRRLCGWTHQWGFAGKKKKKSIQESASESNGEEEINPPKCGCGFTENKAVSTPNDSRYVSKRLIGPRRDSPLERYIKNDTLVGWCFLFMQTFAAPPRFENLMCIWLVALLAPEYKRNFFFLPPLLFSFSLFFSGWNCSADRKPHGSLAGDGDWERPAGFLQVWTWTDRRNMVLGTARGERDLGRNIYWLKLGNNALLFTVYNLGWGKGGERGGNPPSYSWTGSDTAEARHKPKMS